MQKSKIRAHLKMLAHHISGGRLDRYLTKHDNPVFGFLFTLTQHHYTSEGLVFSYPKKLVGLGFRSRFLFDLYELPERQLLKRHLRPTDQVLELGGCMGVIACVSNKLMDPKLGKHVVVEANPDLIPTLFANRTLNKSWFLVEFCCVASGSHSTFFLHDLIVGGSSTRPTTRSVQVVNRSLVELQEKHGRFNVLIMDIEGGEYDLIRTYADLLQNYRLIIMELHDSILGVLKAEECRVMLRKIGFKLDEICEATEVWLHDEASPPTP